MNWKSAHGFLTFVVSMVGVVLIAGTTLVRAGAADSAATVKITVGANNNWTLQILQSSPLRAVLGAMCERSQTVCDISPEFKDDVVVPMVVQGAPMAVISKLLEGARVNYSYIPPTAQEKGRLIVDNSPAGTMDNSAQSMQNTSPEVHENPSFNMNPNSAESTSPASSNPNVANSGEAANVMEAPSGSQVLPFADSHGHLLIAPVDNQTSTVSPFIDSKGNFVPIPTNDGNTAMSPFMGSNGQPVPVPADHDKPATMSPFIDRNGNFIPIPR
jgi:hypothetical protein